MEEEDKLEILGNLLECWTKGGDGNELGDVENHGEDDYRNNVVNGQHFVTLFSSFFLKKLSVISIMF